MITDIHVQDGTLIKRGDVLIELDPTMNRADQHRAFNEYSAAKVDATRIRALIAGQSTFESPPPDSDPQQVLLQRQLLRDQVAEYQARVIYFMTLLPMLLAIIHFGYVIFSPVGVLGVSFR